jgi:hypothetical protein
MSLVLEKKKAGAYLKAGSRRLYHACFETGKTPPAN